MPDDADPPQIVKADANADAILRLAATAPPDVPIEDLTQVVNDEVVDRLAAIDGVADVQLYGDRDPLVRIILDPDALAARHLGVTTCCRRSPASRSTRRRARSPIPTSR